MECNMTTALYLIMITMRILKDASKNVRSVASTHAGSRSYPSASIDELDDNRSAACLTSEKELKASLDEKESKLHHLVYR